MYYMYNKDNKVDNEWTYLKNLKYYYKYHTSHASMLISVRKYSTL